MTRDELNNAYFEWLYKLVCDDENSPRLTYRRLMAHLHMIDFEYTLAMDGNRAEDGINLRYRFGSQNGFEDAMIASYLDDRSCSVLEMMIALSIRCEEHIMDNPEVGDRTGQWFWSMIVNLGLGTMNDSGYDRGRVEATINRFLIRDYARNGEGSLFVVNDYKHDMRTVEIWYQMCAYLREMV